MSRLPEKGRSVPKRPAVNIFLCRVLSGFLALCLASPVPGYSAGEPETAGPAALISPEALRLPADIGKVEEVFSPGRGGPAVYFIQDAHAVFEAQKNIAQSILYLRKNSGVGRVAFEGGSGDMDATVIRSMPDEFLKKQILEKFMRRGELSGTAWAAVFDEGNARYSGLENWKLYEQNYRAFLKAQDVRPRAFEAIRQAEEQRDAKRRALYPEDLERLHQAQTSDLSGQGYTALVQTLGDINARRQMAGQEELEKNYPEFTAFLKASAEIHEPEKAERYARDLADHFLKTFVPSLDAADGAEFNRRRQAFVTGQDDFVFFLYYLQGLAMKRRLALEFPAFVKSWVAQAEVLTSLEGSRLMKETEALTRRVENTLAVTPQQREMLEQERSLRLLRKLAALQLTLLDYQDIQSAYEAHASVLAAEDRRLLEPARNFYEKAVERDPVFMKKIENLLGRAGSGSLAVVAGGFHRGSLTQKLREKNIPYAVITPRVESLEGAEQYEKVMLGELSFSGRLQDSFYKAFMSEFAEEVAQKKGGSEMPRLAREWRDGILRELAARNKLTASSAYLSYVRGAQDGQTESPDREYLTEKIRDLLREFRDGIEKEIFERLARESRGPFAGTVSAPMTASTLNASASVDILIPDSPNGRNSPVMRAARDGWRSVLPDEVLNIAGSQSPQARQEPATKRSELRALSESGVSENYLLSGIDFTKTDPVYRDDNEFVNASVQSLRKTLKEVRQDISDQAFSDHEKMRLEYGFLPRGHSAQIQTVYEIFEKVVQGYNRVAAELEMPLYTGKLFVVDSPDVNAFVHSEHPDVYLYAGFLQDLERYRAQQNRPVTHEDIAAVLAHELSHVMQNSAYVGVGYSDALYEERLPQEILSMKRNAEYDADRNAIHILTEAGYTPRMFTDFLQFLSDITPESTSEHAFSDHPHPSLRISELMRSLNDSKLITLSWDVPLHPFSPEQSFLKLPSTHLRGLEEIKTLDDLFSLESSADSLQKVLELGRAAGEWSSLARLKKTGQNPDERKFFAQRVLGYNVIALSRQILKEVVSNDEPLKLFPVDETGAFLESSGIRSEDVDVLGFEVIPQEERSRGLEVPRTGSRFREEILREMGYVLYRLNQAQEAGPEAHRKKLAALQAIKAMVKAFLDQYDAAEYAHLDIDSEPRTPAEEVQELLGEGRASALERLSRIPLSVYMNFGKENLRVEKSLTVEGVSLGGVSLERESASLYRTPLALTKIETADERRTALNTALYSWMNERYREESAGRAVLFLKRLSERAKTLVANLPESVRTGDSEQDAFILEEVRSAIGRFVETGKFPEEESLLKRMMRVLTSAEHPEGPAVFPVASQQRSPLYERESGLGSHAVEKPKNVAKAFQHQDPYLEIAGDWRRAAEILAEDFKQEAVRIRSGPGGKMNMSEILQRNLEIYSPYFRKAVLREVFETGRGRKSLYPSLEPALYRHDDVFKALREVAGEADGYQLMVAFMNAKRLGRIEDSVFLNGAEKAEFLKDYADFFEKILLPARPADGFMIPTEVAASFLQARLQTLEDSGVRAENLSSELVSKTLDLLSRHTLLEINKDSYGEIVAEGQEEPRLSKVSQVSGEKRDLSIERADQTPGAFFEPPATLLEQAFFVKFLSLPLADLERISHNQETLLATAADTPRKVKGRFPVRTDASEEGALFLQLLNTLVIRGILQELGAKPEDLSELEVHAYGTEMENRSSSGAVQIHFRLDLGSYVRTSKMVWDYFKTHPDFDRKAFWARLKNVFIKHNMGLESDDDFVYDGSNRFVNEFFENERFRKKEDIVNFADMAPLMEESYVTLQVQKDRKFSEPTHYLSALSENVSSSGFKQNLFKNFVFATRGGPRSFVDVRKRPALDILRDMNENFLTNPSLLRDGMIDMLERQIFPEMHANSLVKAQDWENLISGSNEVLEWFFSKTLTEIPLEWMNLSENFPAKIKAARARSLLEFYEQAIPAVADPQRQLRFGLTALKLWRLLNPKGSFFEELAAIERYFPQPTKLRDEALEELFNRHDLPSETVSYQQVQHAQRLYSVYHRMIFEHEATNADAAFQAVQSMLASASRTERMQTALWLLNPESPMPGPFLLAKQEKNILFDDLPRDLRFAPEFLKSDMLMNILTGENGILNPRTDEDRQIKKEFAAQVFEHFFPLKTNVPAETGLSAQALTLLKEMFVFAMDQYDQGRGAAIMDTLRAIEPDLGRKTYGERLAVLLGSLGPVGVKMGQILSENQQLVPDARLRRDLAGLKHGAQSISKIAVIKALIAAGLDPSEFRVGRLLGAASMKQVHAGYLLVNGEWKEVVFKVLRPALNRTIDQDLSVLENMFHDPSILAKVRGFVPDFEPGEMIRKIRFMIEEERDFLKESDNSRALGEIVDSYPSSFYQYEGLDVRMPKIIQALPTVIVEERIRGLEADVLEHRGFFGRKAKAKAAKGQLKTAETKKILALSPGKIRRLARNHFFYQVFQKGLFHADPHAGNLMVEAEHLVFIDAGLIGRLVIPEQVEAARVLVKGVLLRDPDKVFEGFRGILEAGGDSLESPETLKAAIREALLPSKMGNLNELLNDLGGLITRERGESSAQAGAFIKAWTQALWLMPLTPATLFDLARVLNLSRKEVFRTLAVTGIPNLVLKPFRQLRQTAARIQSFFSELREKFRRKLALYRARLRLKRLQDNMASFFADLMNTVEDKTKSTPPKIYRDPSEESRLLDAPLVRVGSTFNTARTAVENVILESEASAVEGLTRAELYEALAVYGEYSAFLLKEEGHLFKVDVHAPESEEKLLGNFANFQGAQAYLRSEEEVQHSVIRMLSRLYLARERQSEGKPYKDLLGFASAEQEFYARQYLEEYLLMLDIEDMTDPLTQGETGEFVSRRDLVMNKFPGYRPPSGSGRGELAPWLKYSLLDIFVPGTHTAYGLRKPKETTLKELQTPFVSQRVENEELPAYARSRQLRGRLKKMNGRMYAFFADRENNPRSMVVRVRERFSSRENPVTLRLEVHNFEAGETVILHFTDQTYEDFLKTGRASEFKRIRFNQAPQAAEAPGGEGLSVRSELRNAAEPETVSSRVSAPAGTLTFLLGDAAGGVSAQSARELSDKNLKRFQAVLARFSGAQENRLAQAESPETLKALVNSPDYERQLLSELAAVMEENGFVAGEDLQRVFTQAVAELVGSMRLLVNAPPAENSRAQTPELLALTPQGRALLEKAAQINLPPAAEEAILLGLKRLNPEKYETLKSLKGIFGTSRENIPWLISLGNLLGSEREVSPDALKYLDEHFEKAGTDFGVLYGVGTGEEALALALKQEFQKLWPVGARFPGPVKEGKLPAALRLGTGLYLLLAADQRFDPAGGEEVRGIHVAEDVAMAREYTTVEKIKINSLPLLNPYLEEHALAVEGSRYRLINRQVFNFFVNLINDLARLGSVQQLVGQSA